MTSSVQLFEGATGCAPYAAPRNRPAPPRPVRVMHLMYMLRVAGMELGVVKLVNALDRARVASSICSCRPADAARERLSPDVPLFELQRRQGNDPWLIARLARLMGRERPDIVHTHAWGTLCEGLVAARLARVPALVHGEHGTLDLRPRNVLVQRWGWRRADQVLAVSSRLAERMSSQVDFPAARIRTIRNGVDLQQFAPGARDAARLALGLRPQDLVFGTVGRLVPVKDQATLLGALGRLKARGVPFRALIAGDGPLRHQLRSQADALGIADLVLFLGERRDVPQLLRAMDVFVLSSTSEGMSNTIQEAMGTALPVVATRVGGADELIEHGTSGLLVPPASPEALAEALERLTSDPDARAAMGRAARRRAETMFDVDLMVRQYESLYLDLFASRSGPARGVK